MEDEKRSSNYPSTSWTQNNPAGWGSTWVLKVENAITKVLSADKKTRLMAPSWHDIYVMESVHKVLNPLVDFTDVRCSEAHLTLLQLFGEVLKPEADDWAHQKDQGYCHQLSKLEIWWSSHWWTEHGIPIDRRLKTRYIKDDMVGDVKSRGVNECHSTSQAIILTEAEELLQLHLPKCRRRQWAAFWRSPTLLLQTSRIFRLNWVV